MHSLAPGGGLCPPIPCHHQQMGVLSSMMRRLGSQAVGRRTFTPVEARDLIQRRDFDRAIEAARHLHADTPQRELLARCLEAEVAFRQHRDADAESLFREALKDEPGLAEAHYGLSLVMLARGEVESALRHVQFAVNKFGLEPRFWAQLGLCQLELGNFGLAAKSLGRATRLDPNDKSSWNNLGIAERAHGDWESARRSFQRALELDPGFESARNNLALLQQDLASADRGGQHEDRSRSVEDSPPHISDIRALAAKGHFAEAINICEALCMADPDEPALAIELFRLYREQGDVRSGLDALAAFRERFPQNLDVLIELAKALVKERQFKNAKPLLEQALEARPGDVDLLVAMAETRVEEGRYADAGALMDRAFAADSSLHMKGRLAASHLARCNYEKALELVDEMLAEEPRVADGVAGMRVDALTHLGLHDEALPILDAVIQRFPNEPERRFPRATIHLLNERFGPGWDDYAYRNLSSVKHLRMVAFPTWKGEPLAGRKLLVLAEQGLGDQVMFASCLPDLLALGPERVVVEVVDRIAPTIARSFPDCEVIATKQDAGLEWVRDIGEMDYFIPMGDLPQRFRRDIADFPSHRGYLVAAPQRVQYWRDALAALGPGPKIGISWRGGTEQTRSVLRTMGAGSMASLAGAVHAHWVCLQYGKVDEELAEARAAGMPLHYWPLSISDLDEFAALITALDLVVTVCNTTVHYAGAIGKEVWVLSPRIPEWRYGLRFRTLPWYPSSTMFRQSVNGDWPGVLSLVGQELSRKFHSRPTEFGQDAPDGPQD